MEQNAFEIDGKDYIIFSTKTINDTTYHYLICDETDEIAIVKEIHDGEDFILKSLENEEFDDIYTIFSNEIKEKYGNLASNNE